MGNQNLQSLLIRTDNNNDIKIIAAEGEIVTRWYFLVLEEPDVDMKSSHVWFKMANIHPETEGFVFAIQDQIINTKNYKKHIIGNFAMNNNSCRIFKGSSKTIQHIISSSSVFEQVITNTDTIVLLK